MMDKEKGIHGEELVKKLHEKYFGVEEPPQWFKDKLKENMMKGSPKVRGGIPKRLYHGSPVENFEAIKIEGLKASRLYGQLYFCYSMGDVALFMEEKKSYSIFEVDTTKLLRKRFRVSLDHNKRFYPCEALAYYSDVPPDAITCAKIVTN